MAASLFKSHLTKLTRDEMAKRRKESFDPVKEFHENKFHPVANNMSVGIWKGWNASLIVSKQKGLPVVAWDGSIEEAQAEERKKKIEPSSVELSLMGKVGPLNRCGRKRKRIEMFNFQQQNPAANNTIDSALAHPAASLFDEMGVEDMKLFKEGVDALSMHVMLTVSYLRLLHELLGDDSYRCFMESVFRSVANFVLSVFDKEDFERIRHYDEIGVGWKTVCSMLPDKIGTSTKEEVVGKAVDTVIKESHRFPTLTDHDFCQILGRYAELIGEFETHVPVDYVGDPYKFDLWPTTMNDRIICRAQWLKKDEIPKSFWNNVAEEAIQNFVPLKEYCKAQLGLELLCTNGYRVSDTLVIEVLKDIKIDMLLEITHKAPKEYEDFDFSNPRAVVSHVLIDIVKGLYRLGWFKSRALKYSQDGLANCLTKAFGPCKAEVIEVIKMADHDRRLNNKRSISLENVRYGLSLSRVGEFVKEIPAGCPPKFSIVEFFKLSRQKAIDMDDKKVGLQHLVLAMNTVLSKDLMENASLVGGADNVVARHLKYLKKRNINKQPSVRSWKEYSPMYRILKSKFRILGGTIYRGAHTPIKCVRRVRKCRDDFSWIRMDRRTSE